MSAGLLLSSCCCGTTPGGCVDCLGDACPEGSEFCACINVNVAGVTPLTGVSPNSYSVEVDGDINDSYSLDGVDTGGGGACGYLTYMGVIGHGRIKLFAGTVDEVSVETDFVLIVTYACNDAGNLVPQARIVSVATLTESNNNPIDLFNSLNNGSGTPNDEYTTTDGPCRRTTASYINNYLNATTDPTEGDINQFGYDGTVEVVGCC